MATKIENAEKKLADRPELVKLLKFVAKKSATARQIAERFDCSKPTVYARVRAMADRGVTLKEDRVRDGSKGPLAVSYSF